MSKACDKEMSEMGAPKDAFLWFYGFVVVEGWSWSQARGNVPKIAP